MAPAAGVVAGGVVSEKVRMPLLEAGALAASAATMLSPYCERVVVAGSIRRKQADVDDVEIVCVPKVSTAPAGLFGDFVDETNELDVFCREMLVAGVFGHRVDKNGRPAFGTRLKRLTYEGFALDLFSVLAPAQWGVILAIRTGPADFSHRLVTPRSQGGLMPNWLKCRDGAFWRLDGSIATPEEADVFAVIGLPYVAPEQRTGRERIPHSLPEVSP